MLLTPEALVAAVAVDPLGVVGVVGPVVVDVVMSTLSLDGATPAAVLLAGMKAHHQDLGSVWLTPG
jgi:hypothetical protein